ncbi:MAG: SDR family oxidoreductase [Mastigocoleus sp. MO_167.B18]|nr:SDR family oxidoreductase [Mastigocoleus sp. MO_167.B18]
MSDFCGQVALVTGASRGVGASIARMLASAGADVVINYRSKSHRAFEVADAIRANGRKALLTQADITDESEMTQMMKLVEKEFDRLNLLFLNASGGMEKNKPDDYAMQINLTAQSRAVDLFLPLIPEGGRIVFITSHLAHFYGQKPGYPMYESVAKSKKAGEEALRNRIPELTAKGIKLVVVSGDFIEGTITPKLMQRKHPDLLENRRKSAGSLPNIEDFARAIVNAAMDSNLESGATVFVGSTEWETV